MKPARNYPVEYSARIARASARGLSRSQARGHPRPGEGKTFQDYDRRLELALREWRESGLQMKSAHKYHVAPERLREFAQREHLVQRVQGRWHFLKDNRVRQIPLYSNGNFIVIRVLGFTAASEALTYMADVGRFLDTNKLAFLRKWIGKGIEDVHGRWHPFETRPNILYRLNMTEHEPFEQLYRIIA
jgi:hypothetical protein